MGLPRLSNEVPFYGSILERRISSTLLFVCVIRIKVFGLLDYCRDA